MKKQSIKRFLLNTFGLDIKHLTSSELTREELDYDLPRLIQTRSPLIFDVGANKGQTIELLQRLFPEGHIVAFEPNPELLPRLKSLYGTKGVTVEGMIVGNVCKELPFNLFGNNELSSVLELDRNDSNPFATTPLVRVVQIHGTTLDVYCTSKRITAIDLLKIDTQGYDLEVLKGAHDLLARGAVQTILVEVNFAGLYRNQCSFGELECYLHRLGYGLVTFYEIARENGCIRWATACFKRFKRTCT